jgi:exodeoxyribonuclease VII large subunit
MTDAPRINVVELTVSELSNALKRAIEDGFGYVRVRGEISGFKGAAPSGHCYFRLKDDKAVLDAVIWKGSVARMRVKPQEGLEVVVTGKITTFAGSSKYQIVIETLEPAGVGALMALLEERKKKLAAEGLFAAERKRLLPFLPEVIGVITSPTGAVIRDILHRLADRFPRQVLVWPVKVQGEGSAEQVAAAINGFNAFPFGRVPRPDVIIVARGGGSLEDLWSFNEEIVVRAAAASAIPLISAVGHETDVTLIDFASDKRAPTPTAAAEMAVPVRADLITRVSALNNRRVSCWQRGIEHRRKELRSLARALPGREDLFALARQRLDAVTGRLPLALRSMSMRRRDRLVGLSARLGASLRANTQAHHTKIAHDRHRLAVLQERGRVAFENLLDRKDARLERAGQLLTALSYRGVLARGFALVRGSEGQPLRSASAIAPGQRIDIEFTDGRVGAVAEGSRPIEYAPPPPPRRRRRDVAVPGQGSLF